MKIFLLITLLTTSHHMLANELEVYNQEIQDIFVVPIGYDTNDNIEVTFTTQLPNSCFIPHKTIVQRIDHQFKIIFKVKRRNLSGCEGRPSTMLKNPVFYEETISLGELSHGEYSVSVQGVPETIEKKFAVTRAITTNIDDFLYAPISNAYISELIYTNTNAKVIISGIIQEKCLFVSSQDIKVEKYGNVFLVLPKAQINPEISCESTQKPLQKIVNLGTIDKTGIYYIHVRSQSGLSVNKVFRVKDKALNQSGSGRP